MICNNHLFLCFCKPGTFVNTKACEERTIANICYIDSIPQEDGVEYVHFLQTEISK